MKITVLLASRGRPEQLAGALYSLHNNASGEHDVQYCIGCDVDDPATIGIAKTMSIRLKLGYRVAERQASLGSLINQLALDIPADVYTSFCDDTICLTKGWDKAIAEAYEKNPQGVWWWTPAYKDPVTVAVVSEAWRAAAGRIYTDYFPFWFDDLWLLEVWILATENPWVYIDAKLADFPRATHRMRDLRFWHDFYHHTRPMRVAEAKKIAAALGWPVPTTSEILGEIIGRVRKDFIDNAEKIEANQGEVATLPTPEYKQAKARAEMIMKLPLEQNTEHKKELLKRFAGIIERYDAAVNAG